MNHNHRQEEEELERVGVSLPGQLLGQFDEILEMRGYGSRSEGIRDAIRMYLNHYPREPLPEDPISGVAIAVCETHRMDYSSLNEVARTFSDTVTLSFDADVDSGRKLKIFLVRGTSSRFRDLVSALRAQKSVEMVKTVVSPVQ